MQVMPTYNVRGVFTKHASYARARARARSTSGLIAFGNFNDKHCVQHCATFAIGACQRGG